MSLPEAGQDFEHFLRQHSSVPELGDETPFFELLDALPAAVYVTDRKGRITYYNKAAADLWGQRPALGDAEWCGSWKLFWPDGTPLPHAQCPMAIALKEKRAVRGMEAIAERPDGTRVPFIPYPTPLRNAEGEIIGAVNMLVDISERKRSEEIAQRLASIVESSDDAIISTDLNGIIRSWNKSAERFYSYTAEEVIGKPVTILIPRDRQGEDTIIERIQSGERVEHYETVRLRKDGSRIDISLTVSPVRNAAGRLVGASKIARDITERKRAQEALQHSEQELRDFVENATVGMHWVGPNGTIIWANRRELDMLGFSQEEYVGHNIAEFHADRTAIEDILQRLVNRETLNNYEARLRCKDGSIRHVLINSNVLWKDGKFVHTRCFTRDITERRQAEEREREHQKQVATELADMRRLQEISSRLIQEHNGGLYDGILDAAISLLRSDMATMQMFDPTKSQLRLLGARGFDPADIGSFEWVGPDTGTSCAAALRTGRRVVIPDIETCELVVGTPAQEGLRKCGIRSAQSTPLIARTGELIGMITNHWREPHEPTERELLLIDVLARQAADLIERKRNEEQIVLLAREAEHRAKNVLATVQATVHLTQSETPEGLKRAIEGRIGALANVHRLFVQSRWTGAELHALVAEEIAPYSQYGETRVHIDGPNLFLEPNAAQTIAVTLHELTTNAAKYGALSVPNGHVQIGWSRAADGRLIFRWTETGGPRVKSPTRKGFGTRVMDGMIRGQAKGELRFDWHAEGLACEFILPICEKE